MKIKSIPLIIFSCLFSGHVLADENCFVIGFHEPNTHTYDGPTFCNKAQFQDITVRGPLQLKHSNISGQVNVSGPIEASNTTLGSIQIEKQFTSQKISLKQHSRVHGNIVFLGFPGVVYKSDDSTVTGKVINGSVTIIKK